ncbi:hypothetical protein TcWFU_001352 [Taenia crassiceps]|uniref:Uncharacterized protein n=1 Tax=Taenia crassiceps TaxID=6207 RepID=A0ABR4QFN5_9CEST
MELETATEDGANLRHEYKAPNLLDPQGLPNLEESASGVLELSAGVFFVRHLKPRTQAACASITSVLPQLGLKEHIL